MPTVFNPTQTPVCSICIANFNGVGVIEDCISSVLAQNCDFSFEVIVHDDASTDDSVDIIRQLYPGITLIVSEANVGFCVSNNRMVEAANGQFILLLNNDAALFHDALQILYQASDPLAPAILGLPQYDFTHQKLLNNGFNCDLFLNPVPLLEVKNASVAMVSGACLWMPHSLWRDLGGFPDWFGSVAEDLYLCSLARIRGHQVRVLGVSGFTHHVGYSLGGGKIGNDNRLVTSRKRRSLSERNKSFVMTLSYPFAIFLAIFPIHLFLLVSEGLLLALVKRDWSLFRTIYLNSLESLWSERKRLFDLRRTIQARRKINSAQFIAGFLFLPYKLVLLFRHGFPHFK